MEKIDFVNNTTPALNATNLNKLQQNVENDIGDLDDLQTQNKTNLVNAINEAASTGGGGGGDTLPINAIVEYDGVTVPSGYEQIEDDRILLWENQDPTEAFAQQTIQLSSSNYDELLIYYKEATSNNYMYCARLLKGYGTRISCGFTPSDVGIAYYSREIQRTSDTQYYITSARFYYGNNTKGEINTTVVPVYIYGIRN